MTLFYARFIHYIFATFNRQTRLNRGFTLN
nr:MAG TPA: hypothetical protein [Caudoviricetes sp.]